MIFVILSKSSTRAFQSNGDKGGFNPFNPFNHPFAACNWFEEQTVTCYFCVSFVQHASIRLPATGKLDAFAQPKAWYPPDRSSWFTTHLGRFTQRKTRNHHLQPGEPLNQVSPGITLWAGKNRWNITIPWPTAWSDCFSGWQPQWELNATQEEAWKKRCSHSKRSFHTPLTAIHQNQSASLVSCLFWIRHTSVYTACFVVWISIFCRPVNSRAVLNCTNLPKNNRELVGCPTDSPADNEVANIAAN